MVPKIDVHEQALARAALALLLGLIANTATAQSIQGTATYRERIALPTAAVFDAAIEDVSRADAPADVIARTRIPSPGNPPIAFTIAYDPARIVATHRYVVRATILVGGTLLFTTDTATLVITQGSPSSVSLTLRKVGGGQAAPSGRVGNRPLEGTEWKATELGRKPLPAQDPKREAYLLFQAGGRVSGSDGCNRITGTYELTSEVVTFGQMAGTQMACVNTAGEIERAFRDALKRATRLRIAGDRLELFDMTGTRAAVFTARAQASWP